MGMKLEISRFETIRGGHQERLSFSDYVKRTCGQKTLPFVVERIELPGLGEALEALYLLSRHYRDFYKRRIRQDNPSI